ncbi:MAG: DNA topoisomerase I [Legionellales bacterium]|nr:DNA topoisomerase I [Legionellales bacterium]
MTSLVVVESPAKAKTIGKYLGKDVKVLASYGHVRDLRAKEGAVDPENDFKMRYEVIERNAKHVDAIKKALKKCDELVLATDPDREGEAIAFHIYELMEEAGLIGDKEVKRVVFYEITKSAVQAAFTSPRELSQSLIDAQQARRALDYLVGFTLSPLLWKKVRPGLSAGRVQSPALRMIVERELDIEAFEAKEYWSIVADCKKGNAKFQAKLNVYDSEKLKQFSITNEEQASKIHQDLIKRAKGELEVINVEKKSRKRNPAAPFTTSTLQQEAARKLGFGAQRTMRIAQQLYEGIDTGQGAIGLITYMRTDSVNLSQEATAQIRDMIAQTYGADHVPETPRAYKTKSKNAQEAHEAIRPADITIRPEAIKDKLKPEQLKLYELIWKRTLASQMIHATIDTVAVDLKCGKDDSAVFRTNGSTVKEAGFLRAYEEGTDDKAVEADSQEKRLPTMETGDKIKVSDIVPNQHFTEPPPRFTEASLVKALEEYGIGRPSTYASIISTLVQREYVLLEKKRFTPTDVGRVVAKFLTNYFTQYVDYEFTARLETDLDDVAEGDKQWKPLLGSFWDPFKDKVKDIDENVQRKDVTQEAMDEECPDCGKPLATRLGKRGRFVGCTGYPECKYTRSMGDDNEEEAAPEALDRDCPKCGEGLVIKAGRYGKFIGCSGYPNCKHMEPLEKPEDTGISCPECKEGHMLKRKSRYGKIFYSCEKYPKCKYAVWYPPIQQPCPTCQWPVTVVKTTKRKGTERMCPQKPCDFIEPYEEA